MLNAIDADLYHKTGGAITNFEQHLELTQSKLANFSKAIKRAMIACENSGHNVADEFPDVRKFVEVGATTKPPKRL